MIITSLYSVFSTSKMDELFARFERTGSLKMFHHYENDVIDYYVMKDSCGNSTDFVQFKNKKMPEGFFALRMNVNDFDKMKELLIQKKYVLEGDIVESSSNTFGIFKSTTGEPNVILFYHKINQD